MDRHCRRELQPIGILTDLADDFKRRCFLDVELSVEVALDPIAVLEAEHCVGAGFSVDRLTPLVRSFTVATISKKNMEILISMSVYSNWGTFSHVSMTLYVDEASLWYS